MSDQCKIYKDMIQEITRIQRYAEDNMENGDLEAALMNFLVISNTLYWAREMNENLQNKCKINEGKTGDICPVDRQYNRLKDQCKTIETRLNEVLAITKNLQEQLRDKKELCERMQSASGGDVSNVKCENIHQTIFKDKSSDCITFDNVIGLDAAKEAMKSAFIYPLLYPNLYPKQAKGVLLYGPPGTGKTFLMKAAVTQLQMMAENIEILFFAPTGADLKGKFVGETEKNITNYFECASRAAENCMIFSKGTKKVISIIFIDEIDSIAKDRNEDDTGIIANAVNTLLQKMDGVKKVENVAVVAATNFPWKLDSAIDRRFTEKIYIGLPSTADIINLIKLDVQLHTTIKPPKPIKEGEKGKEIKETNKIEEEEEKGKKIEETEKQIKTEEEKEKKKEKEKTQIMCIDKNEKIKKKKDKKDKEDCKETQYNCNTQCKPSDITVFKGDWDNQISEFVNLKESDIISFAETLVNKQQSKTHYSNSDITRLLGKVKRKMAEKARVRGVFGEVNVNGNEVFMSVLCLDNDKVKAKGIKPSGFYNLSKPQIIPGISLKRGNESVIYYNSSYSKKSLSNLLSSYIKNIFIRKNGDKYDIVFSYNIKVTGFEIKNNEKTMNTRQDTMYGVYDDISRLGSSSFFGRTVGFVTGFFSESQVAAENEDELKLKNISPKDAFLKLLKGARLFYYKHGGENAPIYKINYDSDSFKISEDIAFNSIHSDYIKKGMKYSFQNEKLSEIKIAFKEILHIVQPNHSLLEKAESNELVVLNKEQLVNNTKIDEDVKQMIETKEASGDKLYTFDFDISYFNQVIDPNEPDKIQGTVRDSELQALLSYAKDGTAPEKK